MTPSTPPGRPIRVFLSALRARRLVGASASAAGLFLLACGGPPDMEKTVGTVDSWTASVRLAAAERRAGATTDRYTAQLREKAAAALDEGRRTLAAAARSADDRSRAHAVTDSLARAIRLLDAVGAR